MQRKPRGGFRKLVALGASLALVAGALGSSPAAAQTEGCPQVMPTDQLTKGMRGRGLTVRSGTRPEPFDVEILGVLEDGIGPGRDMIVIDTSGPAIEANGGIWYGMSGSPVYVDGKLVGAVAFGLSFGPSSIAGVTAAEDMLQILGYPAEAEEPQTADQGYARRAGLSAAMRRMIARHESVSEDDVGASMVRLKVPLNVSGAVSRAMTYVRKAVKREGLALIPYAGSSSAPGTQPAEAPPEPGGNFAAAISYGDVTLAGVGTTTVVCDGRALAFGHPFSFEGSTSLGANGADVITVVDDPVFGPFKLANIGGQYGIVDQDRLAGIRADLGEGPHLIPLLSTVSSPDTLRTRDGETDVVESEFVPFLTFIHLLTNIDTTFDQVGEGSSTLTWTIKGTTESGESWELNRSNLFASEFDIAVFSLFELEGQLFQLFHNEFEDIEFDSVDVDATVEDEVKQYTITDVLVAKNEGAYKDVRRVRVAPADVVRLRVLLEPHDESEEKSVDLSVTIPRRPRSDGTIQISGAQQDFFSFFCFFEGADCADETAKKIETFAELVEFLETRPKNNELFAKLRMGGRRVKSADMEVLDQVVQGRKTIRVLLGDGGGGSEPKSMPVCDGGC